MKPIFQGNYISFLARINCQVSTLICFLRPPSIVKTVKVYAIYSIWDLKAICANMNSEWNQILLLKGEKYFDSLISIQWNGTIYENFLMDNLCYYYMKHSHTKQAYTGLWLWRNRITRRKELWECRSQNWTDSIPVRTSSEAESVYISWHPTALLQNLISSSDWWGRCP